MAFNLVWIGNQQCSVLHFFNNSWDTLYLSLVKPMHGKNVSIWIATKSPPLSNSWPRATFKSQMPTSSGNFFELIPPVISFAGFVDVWAIKAYDVIINSDYLTQEMEKDGQTSSFLPFSRHVLKNKLRSLLMFLLSIGTLNFTTTRKIVFLSEYVPQKPHAKQPKLSNAEQFLVISFSLQSPCIMLPLLLQLGWHRCIKS